MRFALRRSARLEAIEMKCDIIISMLGEMRRSQKEDELDDAIERMHAISRKMLAEGRREKERHIGKKIREGKK